MTDIHLLTVRLRIGLFALPVRWVEEVVRFAALTPLPGAPRACLGVLNLRGRILPVLEPLAWLEERAPERGVNDLLVITDLAGRKVAFAVDELVGVSAVPQSRIEPLSHPLDSSRWVQGLFTDRDDISVVLDLPALLAAADARGLGDAERALAAEGAGA